MTEQVADSPFIAGRSGMLPGALQPVDVGGVEYVNLTAAMLVRVVDIDRRWRVQVVIADRTTRLLASPVGVGSENGRRAVERVLQAWAEGPSCVVYDSPVVGEVQEPGNLLTQVTADIGDAHRRDLAAAAEGLSQA